MITPPASVTTESTFFVRTNYGGDSIKASSWEDAMTKAAEYMAKSYYGANERGIQRISYTVCRLPIGTRIWSISSGDYVSPNDLAHCESQDAIYTEEEEA